MHSTCLSSYPRNSPQAAARILAVALISNGKMQPSELAAMEAHDARGQLDITDLDWHDVVHDLCAHLLSTATHGTGTDCRIDPRLIEQMLDEVDDVALQRRVLRLCTVIADADGQIDEGEETVLLAAVNRWELHPEEQPLLEPLLYGLDFQVASRSAPANPDRSSRGPTVPRAMLRAPRRAHL